MAPAVRRARWEGPVIPAAARPLGHGSLRVAPAEARSYSGLVRLSPHSVTEIEHRSGRLRDD